MVAYEVGQEVWYCRRFQPPQPAVIASVDRSIIPPSYGIRLGDNFRDTEGDRLFPRRPGEAGPSQGAVFGKPSPHEPSEDGSDDTFGGFEAAPSPSVSQPEPHQLTQEDQGEDFGDFAEASGPTQNPMASSVR